MKDKNYYFGIGFATAMVISMLVISCAEPLSADYSSCVPGSSEWCPMYVKVVE